MTSQPQPPPGEGKTAGQYLRQLRDLAAYVLVGATAVLLFGAVLQLIPDGSDRFGDQAQASFGGFVNLPTIAFPLGAVLLAVLVRPQHPKAQLIVLAAVVEYAVAAAFGLFFGVLIGLINEVVYGGARSAFEGLLYRVAWLAVFAVAGYAVFLIWRNLFYAPRPKPQPGVYGKPQYPAPGTFPGQPGYGPPPAGYPQQPGQQAYGAGTYGQPAAPWNQPSGPYPAYGQPTQPVPAGPHPVVGPSAQPAFAPPSSPHPAGPHPAGPHPAGPHPAGPHPAGPHPAGGYVADPQSGFPPAVAEPTSPAAPEPAGPSPAAAGGADPTQAVPAAGPAPLDDRTEKFGTGRPGFGPAEPDPPRR